MKRATARGRQLALTFLRITVDEEDKGELEKGREDE
jgi:hypothetical protein